MTDLEFGNHATYLNKFNSFILLKFSTDAFSQCKMDALKLMITKSDMINSNIDQLSFLLWMLPTEFKTLLNDGSLKFDLTKLKRLILGHSPSVTMDQSFGITPLGGFATSFSRSNAHYNCVKFIGQFTNDQEVYDECLSILEAMPLKLKGPIKDPDTCMYLMNYNPNVNTDMNKWKTKPIGKSINKLNDFYDSIYSPSPSYNLEYTRYHHDIASAYESLGSDIAITCLVDKFSRDWRGVMTHTSQLRDRVKGYNLRTETVARMETILSEIDKQKYVTEVEETDDMKRARITKEVHDELKILDAHRFYRRRRNYKDCGIRGTYYVAMGLMNTSNALGDLFRVEDLHSAVNDGHELASHTFSHQSSRKVSCAAFREDARKGWSAIQDMGGHVPTRNFPFPRGEVTLSAKLALGNEMASCRGIYGGVNGPHVNLNLLLANSLYGDGHNFERVAQLIRENQERKGWLIFYTHDVSPAPSRYGCSPKFLDLTVRMAVENGAKVLPVAEVMARLLSETPA